MGQHLRKRRLQAGLTQKDVAEQIGANHFTYLLWEGDRTNPGVRFYPAIFAFLGYDPFPPPTTVPESILSQRRRLGLSLRAAAGLIGVDEGTLTRWERGEGSPEQVQTTVQRFLELRVTDARTIIHGDRV
ncbi:MAG: helix-turn-helix domain-containing protein [Rhizomicrobium sp.]